MKNIFLNMNKECFEARVERRLRHGIVRVGRQLRRRISALGLRRLDSTSIPNAPHEIRLFMVVQNESLRLPYLLKYYFSHGVDRMFVVDNNSQDDTASFLLKQECTHLFQTKESFKSKIAWLDLLLRRYGVGHWCILVDADEFLTYPHWEKIPLRDLCDFLDQKGYDALHCLLLDMYSNKPLDKTSYEGGNPFDVAPYFDSDSHHKRSVDSINCAPTQDYVFAGGMRKRVFGVDVCLSKFPLIRFNKHMFLGLGTHTVEGASIADIQGVLFHFKFFSDFPKRVLELTKRGGCWSDPTHIFECKVYARKIMEEPDLNLYHPRSVRFVDSTQLLKLGLMKSSPGLDEFVKKIR